MLCVYLLAVLLVELVVLGQTYVQRSQTCPQLSIFFICNGQTLLQHLLLLCEPQNLKEKQICRPKYDQRVFSVITYHQSAHVVISFVSPENICTYFYIVVPEITMMYILPII